MTSNPIFQGAASALITPLTEKGVDFESYGRLIDWQIEQGIDALVLAGTTGEGSTLDDKEHREVLAYAVDRIAGRVPAICTTGSNDTNYAVSLSKFACSIGADALLVITPYYNKTTQRGLIRSFTTIADAVDKPMIIYNVPSRTGLNVEPETYEALSQHPNIKGIKEANGNVSKLVETAMRVGDRMDIYSGDDDQIVPIMSMGGQGVISVLSNIAPRETSELCHRFLRGDVAGAAQMQMKYLPLIRALFCETNPIPVKAALWKMGFCENYLRLPLVTMEPEHAEKMYGIMRDLGIL
ncbi:MAG: 4-hydroxy-tetrahydrodipicolinate synthase [Oscillospiraceae bacterium]|nr:4-hydroxy-tetrahydrodipicolinate synthase [Oscillospiraceae bacterium]